MAQRPAEPSPPQVDTGVEEHLASLQTLRGIKRWLVGLIALSLMMQMAFYGAGRFWGLLDVPAPAAAAVPTTAPTTNVSSQPAGMLDRARDFTPHIRTAARITYAATTLVGTACAALLPLALLISISVSLAGRLGGARSMIIGFFQALIVGLLLCPWDRWLDMTNLPIRGALCLFAEVDAALATPLESGLDAGPELLRFGGLPIVTLLFLLAVALRFRRGFLFALERVDPELRIRVI